MRTAWHEKPVREEKACECVARFQRRVNADEDGGDSVFVLPRKYFNEIYLSRSPRGTRAANSGGLSCTMAAEGLEWATNGHNQATATVMKRSLPLSYRDYGNFLLNLPFVRRRYLGRIRLSLPGIRIPR